MSILLQPYNPQWPVNFEQIRTVLIARLEGFEIDIQHIGSTAIPDLIAKPILDIDIIIHEKALLPTISSQLESIGYLSRGELGIEGRFAFRQSTHYTPMTNPKHKWLEHHLYVCYSDSLALKNHLLFRNALLHNKALVAAYAHLKTSLSKDPSITREQYTSRKTDFILSVLAKTEMEEGSLQAIKKANESFN